jgi:hypothetical protein
MVLTIRKTIPTSAVDNISTTIAPKFGSEYNFAMTKNDRPK